MRDNSSTSTTDCIEWRRVTDLKREHNESAMGVNVPNAYTRRSSLGSSQLRHIWVCIYVYASLLIVHYSYTCIWPTVAPPPPAKYSLNLSASLLTWKVCDSERECKQEKKLALIRLLQGKEQVRAGGVLRPKGCPNNKPTITIAIKTDDIDASCFCCILVYCLLLLLLL